MRPLRPEVEARVLRAAHEARHLHAHYMNRDPGDCAEGMANDRFVVSPDGKAFLHLAQAEALETFLTTGDLEAALARGKQEWIDYVRVHNARPHRLFKGCEYGLGSRLCRDDEWSEFIENHIRFLCSSDRENEERKPQHEREAREQRMKNPSPHEFLGAPRKVELEDGDTFEFRNVSRDYLRRITGADGKDCGAGAVWAVDTKDGGMFVRHIMHVPSELVWELESPPLPGVIAWILERDTLAYLTIQADDLGAIIANAKFNRVWGQQ